MATECTVIIEKRPMAMYFFYKYTAQFNNSLFPKFTLSVGHLPAICWPKIGQLQCSLYKWMSEPIPDKDMQEHPWKESCWKKTESSVLEFAFAA